MKIIAYISAAILVFFGVLYIYSAFNPATPSPGGNILTGLISVFIGFGLIWFASRKKTQDEASSQNITLKIDLPGNVNLETLKCQSCGGTLKMENIEMVAGAPVVHCPYCNSTYQLTEEPKW